MQKTERVTDEMVEAALLEADSAWGMHLTHDNRRYLMRVALTAALSSAEEKAVEVKKLDLVVTKEWFERRAKAEADLEIGAGFSVVSPTDADLAQMEVLAERALPQWAQDELARLRSALVDVPAVESEPDDTDAMFKTWLATRAQLTLPNDEKIFGSLEAINSITALVYPTRSSLIQSEEGEIAKLAAALEAAVEWISILRGSTGNIVMPSDDNRDPRTVEERAKTLIATALSTRKGSADGSASGTKDADHG